MKFSYRLIGWIARLLCIAAIIFISIFALDSFDGNKDWLDKMKNFVVHLFPSFIFIVFLLISWNREIVGGVIFFLTGLVLTPYVFKNNYEMNESIWISIGVVAMVTLPFVLIGLLFIWSGRLKKKYYEKL